MVRTAGKLFFILSMFSLHGLIGNVQLKLKATSMHGAALTTAGVGHPFMLEVSMSDGDTPHQNHSQVLLHNSLHDKKPTIQGIEDFYVRSGGLQMTTINGATTTTHRYKVRIDKPGVYTVGPACIEENGSTVRSNTLKLTVVHQEKAEEQNKKVEALLKLSADKSNVVVGEKISCRLRFAFKDDGTIALQSIGEGEISGFTVGEKTGPLQGAETVNGTRYAYGDWVWQVYPKQPGDLVITPYSADVSVKNSEQERHPFAFFFGSSENKKIYSNALKIHVNPLPKHDDTVDGVGEFYSFVATVDHAVAKEGEAIVLTLAIDGDADLATLAPPVLQKVPADFKWYESKNSIGDGSRKNSRKKRFEYIVQGIKDGTYEFAAQQFTYFDTKAREYKTLETDPLTITIKPHFNKQVVAQSVDTQAKIHSADDIQPIDKENPAQEDEPWVLPWWFIFLCIAIPLAGVTTYLVYTFLKQRTQNGKKYAVVQLKKSLTELARARNYTQLYQTFIVFFAQRCAIEPQQVSLVFINEQMRAVGFTEDQLRQWDSFFIALSALTFYSGTSLEGEQMIKQAERWALLFEEKL